MDLLVGLARLNYNDPMALYFDTGTPKKLLATFKKAIDDGHVVTWSYDKKGDFTHNVDQWRHKAWLRPKIVDGKTLILSILRPQGAKVSSEVYAIYHGRFIESMLRHCDETFVTARASSLPKEDDLV